MFGILQSLILPCKKFIRLIRLVKIIYNLNSKGVIDVNYNEKKFGNKELEFAIFCIENVADKLNIDAPKVYSMLTEQTNILNEYIIPEYENFAHAE